jgi:hypothetical protein
MARPLLMVAAMDLAGSNLRPAVLMALCGLLLLGGGTALADVLVETDSERLDEIVDVLNEGADGRVDRLASYADAERVSVTVSDELGVRHVDDQGSLRERLHETLAPLDAPDAELLQVTRVLEGERGRVTVRVRADGEVANLELTLRRDGQTFLLVGARRLG